jgi:hypothetical protein
VETPSRSAAPARAISDNPHQRSTTRTREAARCIRADMYGGLSRGHAALGPGWINQDKLVPAPMAAAWTAPAAGVKAGRRPRVALGLDSGEDVVRLCGVRGRGDRRSPVEVSVSLHDAWSMLICAGWLPQDHVFGWSGALV